MVDLVGGDRVAVGGVEAVGKNREFAQAAFALFDHGIKAVTGRSLREENKELFKEVSRLFTVRNGIAHGGEGPFMNEVRRHVATAGQVFAWCDCLALADTDS
ncbi:hypothetical protein DN069_32380 [Streptacidiphilus pinicola]|uniref:Uncharacterized protein n=1 Tax=Streptacidiphilus pinicola TaxID=2219663 RepID=A0A2X0ID62_9ACTN|nr:hypothetical protein [Streptacidiphilus pinicola]RAG81553.1 hypothetical protein DN069_32380 [Streptacidiphilus pinicola]